MTQGWVGVDLDGTLAVYDGWHGIEHIGKPIPAMVRFVKSLLLAGVEVRIFTARVSEGPHAIPPIEQWCKQYIGSVLPVTATKDFGCVFIVDDRAVSVEKNTGQFLVPPPSVRAVKWHYDPANPDAPAADD